MKFTIQREQLLKTLQLVTGVVERRQTLPVLSNLLVKATDNRLELTGTDLEVELVAECEALVEQTGEATLPARKLADIWRSLADGAEVSVNVEGDRAVVRSGRSRFTLATLPAADFPKVPAGEANVSVQIGQSDLKTLIDNILDLSRIEAGRTIFHAENIDLPALLEGLVELADLRSQH